MNLILLKNTLSLVRKGVMTAFMVVTALHAYAQSTVSGTITAGEDSTPLPGVNILVKGTLQGTISDADGR